MGVFSYLTKDAIFSEQRNCSATNYCQFSSASTIQYCNGQHGRSWQLTKQMWQGHPFVPTEIQLNVTKFLLKK